MVLGWFVATRMSDGIVQANPEVLIPSFFAAVDDERKIPVRAILLVALLSTAIGILALTKSDLVTSIVTFGSLTAYALLHVAVMRYFARRAGRVSWFAHWISPILGIAILIYALWSASVEAKTISGIWLAVGAVIYRSRKMFSFAAAAATAEQIER
jgi:amino acid transporter